MLKNSKVTTEKMVSFNWKPQTSLSVKLLHLSTAADGYKVHKSVALYTVERGPWCRRARLRGEGWGYAPAGLLEERLWDAGAARLGVIPLSWAPLALPAHAAL